MTPGGKDLAGLAGTAPGTVLGFHHIRVPVSDVPASREWYVEVLGFEAVLDYEEEDRLVGVVLRLPAGGTIHLHEQPDFARALKGFAILALSVRAVADLEIWSDRLDDLGVDHGGITVGHSGWFLHCLDPDGLQVQLHTLEQPTAD